MKLITQEETKQYRLLDHDYLSRHGMRHVTAFTLTSISDEPGWEAVTYYGKRYVDPLTDANPNKPHYIYILVNPSVPGICKIGFTTTTVYDRVKQINGATGVITPWDPVFSYKCSDGRALEREIHEELELMGVRVNNRREGFTIDTDSARALIEKLGKKYKTNE
jgi:hypothetical protein